MHVVLDMAIQERYRIERSYFLKCHLGRGIRCNKLEKVHRRGVGTNRVGCISYATVSTKESKKRRDKQTHNEADTTAYHENLSRKAVSTTLLGFNLEGGDKFH